MVSSSQEVLMVHMSPLPIVCGLIAFGSCLMLLLKKTIYQPIVKYFFSFFYSTVAGAIVWAITPLAWPFAIAGMAAVVLLMFFTVPVD